MVLLIKNINTFSFRELMLHANTLTGADAYCFKQFAEALEIIPYTLAENAGLNPIGINFIYIFDH